MPFKYAKLRGRIVEKFGTIGAFAEAVGLSKTMTSGKLTGRFSISRNDIIKWSELLDIPVEEYGLFYFT